MDIVNLSSKLSGDRPWPRLQRAFLSGEAAAIVFDHEQYYLEGCPVVSLLVVAVPADGHGGTPVIVVTDRCDEATAWLSAHRLDVGTLPDLAAAVGAPMVPLRGPWRLEPVHIAKPWGQEIWFTGIEKRGQSRVGDGRHSVPLPWLLALGADQLLMPGVTEPALLKILDPLPEEVFGDLYFELHEEKREVYVVTHVNRRAWPDGRGGIRFGFDQDVRRRYGSDEDFRQAFHQAVVRYERVRRSIDHHGDQQRRAEGVADNEPVAAATLKRWLTTVPGELLAEEVVAREAMNHFTHMLPLAVGDVVKVPCLTPHALQHGVRTVEFQTPVYERKILSFAQKVLTQDHWDTAAAVELMGLEAGRLEPLAVVFEEDDVCLQQVVQFSDFEVLRLTLAAGARWVLGDPSRYKLLMVVDGRPAIDGAACRPEDALLVPAGGDDLVVEALGGIGAVVLICLPS